MLQAYRKAEVTFLKAPVLEGIPGIVHAFSTRPVESDNFIVPSQAGDESDRFMSAVGLTGWPIGRLRQVHSNLVHAVRDNEFANDAPEGDAAYTSLSGMALGVHTADCVPVLIADREARAVAVVHAGWRGTSEGVVRRTVESLVSDLGTHASDLSAAIGPHIGVCCMEVGEEVFDRFQDPELFGRRDQWEKPHLNLAEANRRQLVNAGVLSENVQISTLCTRCREDLFYSYRRDGETAGRMLSVIGIEP